MPAQTGSIDVKANKLAATFSVGKSHIFYAYATDTPTALAVGDQWFVLEDITVDGSTVTTCTSLKRWDGTIWAATTVSDGVFTRINAGSILVGILKAITIQGPTADTFWNLSNGEWQNKGEITLNGRDVDPDGSDLHDYIYDVEMLTHIQDGQFTVSGEDQRAQMTATFVDEKVQGDSFLNGDTPYKNYKGDINANSKFRLSGAMTSFPRGGMKLKGRAIETYSGYGDKSEHDTFRYVRLSPAGNYGPDEIALGSYEDVEMVDGESIGLNRPNRNILLLNGGWKNVEDAVVFWEQVRTYYDASDSAYHFDFHTARCYRPVWPYKPGDTVALSNGTHYWGCLYSSGAQIRLTIPLARPMSEYITGATLTGGQIQVCNVSGTQLFANANIPAHTTALLNAGDTENAIDLAIERTSGNWGATTVRQTVMVRFTDTVITFT